jgi:hypothetical protein
VEAHTQVLTKWTVEQLAGLRHSNGRPVVQLHGNHAFIDDAAKSQSKLGQGSIVNFQVMHQPIRRVDVQATAAI